jgi:Tfp pilus assembly protein PilF
LETLNWIRFLLSAFLISEIDLGQAWTHPFHTMKRPPSAPAGLLNRRLQEAEAAWARKDFQQCIETLQSARRLAPANPDIILQLGRIHGLRYDYAAAERCFEQARRLAPGKTEMLTAVANYCRDFRNPELTERYLRLAVGQPDVPPQTGVKLAELYERLRRLTEAAQLVERTLKLNPGFAPALLVRARLERTAGRLEAAEQTLRDFVNQPGSDHWVQAQAWYELATVLDRQGRYDDAMAAFIGAKKLLLPQAAPHLAELKGLQTRLQLMQDNVSAEMFQRWSAAPLAPPQRLALLCGYARSGTTLLEQVLDSHPDIISAEETDVFLDDVFAPLKFSAPPDAYMLPVLEAAHLPVLQSLRAAYFKNMELCLGQPLAGRLLIDKNPARTFMLPAFLRVFPEIKLLVALRDPRDVVLSCFMQAQMLNPATAADLTLAGGAERYVQIMGIWRTLAPFLAGRYLEIRYEDMVDDLESVARQSLDFLGVPWDAKVLGFDEHARNKLVRSPTYADVTQPVYKRAKGRWQHYQKYLEPHLEKLEPFVKAFGYG